MHYAQAFEDVKEFAINVHSKGGAGNLYVSQTEMAPDKVFFGDEDTGRASVHQILSILLQTTEGSIFYEYNFFQPYELEDAFEMLNEVNELFPKVVVDKEDIEDKLAKYQN